MYKILNVGTKRAMTMHGRGVVGLGFADTDPFMMQASGPQPQNTLHRGIEQGLTRLYKAALRSESTILYCSRYRSCRLL